MQRVVWVCQRQLSYLFESHCSVFVYKHYWLSLLVGIMLNIWLVKILLLQFFSQIPYLTEETWK